MRVRNAERRDRPAIRDVARRSLQASYSLSPEAITGAVSEWYDEAALERATDDDDRRLLVADREGQVVGFAESELSGEDATLLWLHVDPAYRGEGIGTALFEETRDRLTEAGADRMVGRVLADNVDDGTWIEFSTTADLTPVINDITADITDEAYVLSYTTTNPVTDGTNRPVDVEIDDPDEGQLYEESSYTVPSS